MSDLCITVGIFKLLVGLLIYISGIAMTLNRSDVESFIQSVKSYSELDDNYNELVAQDYVYVTVATICMGSMRFLGGLCIVVGEYAEQIHLKLTAIISYILDVVVVFMAPLYFTRRRCTQAFKDNLSLSAFVFGGLECIIFISLVVGLIYSLNESGFKEKWEALKKKRSEMKEKEKPKGK